MSTFILIDSKDRDRSIATNANPASFTIYADQTRGWPSLTRSTNCVASCGRKQVCNLLYCIKLVYLSIPVSATNTSGGALPENEPYILVRLNSLEYPDTKLINTMNGYYDGGREVTFMCVLERQQGSGPEWLQYKCNHTQCIRFTSKNPEMFFKVFTREGPPAIAFGAGITTNTILITDTVLPNPVNPLRQVSALFEFTPYTRDAEYDNQTVEQYQT